MFGINMSYLTKVRTTFFPVVRHCVDKLAMFLKVNLFVCAYDVHTSSGMTHWHLLRGKKT